MSHVFNLTGVNNFVIFEHEISIHLYLNKSFLPTIEHFFSSMWKKNCFRFFFSRKKWRRILQLYGSVKSFFWYCRTDLVSFFSYKYYDSIALFISLYDWIINSRRIINYQKSIFSKRRKGAYSTKIFEKSAFKLNFFKVIYNRKETYIRVNNKCFVSGQRRLFHNRNITIYIKKINVVKCHFFFQLFTSSQWQFQQVFLQYFQFDIFLYIDTKKLLFNF